MDWSILRPSLVLVLSTLVLVFAAGCSAPPLDPAEPAASEMALILPATTLVPSAGGLPYAPVLAVNPQDADHLVVAFSGFVDRTYRIEVAVSRDGGATWTAGAVDSTSAGPYPVALASAVAFAPDGTIYVAARLPGWVDSDAVVMPDQTVVFASGDGGVTFGPPSLVAPGSLSSFLDDIHPPLAVSPDDGALHVAFTQTRNTGVGFAAFATVEQAFVATSRDRGATWTLAPLLPAGLTAVVVPLSQGNASFIGDFQLAALPGGVVHVTWAYRPDFFGDPEIWTATSTDGGLSFEPGQRIAVVTHDDCEIDRDGRGPAQCRWTARQRPSLAVHPDATTLAVAFTSYAQGAARPMLMVSTDAGVSWSEPRPLGADEGRDRFFPRIAYDDQGVLNAVIYGATSDENGTWYELTHLVADGDGFGSRPVALAFPERDPESDRRLTAPSDGNALAVAGGTAGFAWVQHERLLYASLAEPGSSGASATA